MYDKLPRVTFLNGPQQVGKDTLANLICSTDIRFRHLKMSKRLKDALLPFIPDRYGNFDSQEFKSSNLFGISVRQALISLSEDWAKPTFGAAIFGELLAHDMETILTYEPSAKFIISDSRFAGECLPVIKLCGKALIVHIIREGYGWSDDSGSYIHLHEVPIKRVRNNGKPEDMLGQLS
jgi:hypothetical protein